MLTAGVLTFDALGRILVASPPSTSFNGGTPTTVEGFLAVDTNGTPDVFLGGIGYLVNGNIVDTDTDIDPVEGPLTNSKGQVRTRAAEGPPSYWYAGLPFTAGGQLAITYAVPPVDPHAFDNSFDVAFDRAA